VNKTWKPLILLLVPALLSGCATYHPLPLDKQAEQKALAPPDMKVVKEDAAKIKHPLLKPIHFDIKDGLSPDEAAILAVLANPELRAVRDQAGIAGAQLLQARLLPNPVFSYSQDIPSGGSDQGTVNGYGTGLDWLVTSLLTHGLVKKSAREHKEAVDLGIAWEEWQVAEAAKLQVYRLILTEKEVKLARKGEATLEKELSAIRKAARDGEMAESDAAAARSAWYQAKQGLLDLEQTLGEQRQRLNHLLGLPPDDKVPIQEGVRLPRWSSLPAGGPLVKDLSSRRLDLLALKKGYASQDAMLRAAIRAQFPSVVIGLTHLRDTGNVVTTGYAVSIDLPVFDHNQGRIAQERATRRQLYDEYSARLFEARAQVAQVLADMRIMERRISAADQTVPAMDRLARAYRTAFKTGDVNMMELTRAERNMWSSRIDALKLRYDLVALGTALELASGRYFPSEGPAAAGPAGPEGSKP
jgi:outer membrane protein TolC